MKVKMLSLIILVLLFGCNKPQEVKVEKDPNFTYFPEDSTTGKENDQVVKVSTREELAKLMRVSITKKIVQAELKTCQDLQKTDQSFIIVTTAATHCYGDPASYDSKGQLYVDLNKFIEPLSEVKNSTIGIKPTNQDKILTFYPEGYRSDNDSKIPKGKVGVDILNKSDFKVKLD